MNLNKNYYALLGVANTSTEKEIKKAYYKLSFTNHPDKGGDAVIFGEMTEAYDILCGEERENYDKKVNSEIVIMNTMNFLKLTLIILMMIPKINMKNLKRMRFIIFILKLIILLMVL